MNHPTTYSAVAPRTGFLRRHRAALVTAVALALYLRFLLPATATLFYELFHLTRFEPLYTVYGLFKAGSYYFAAWPYRTAACVAAGLLVIAIALGWRAIARRRGDKP